jgi:hypothetical protein
LVAAERSEAAVGVTLERRSVQARARRLRRSQHRLFVAEDAAPVWIVEAKAIGALGDWRVSSGHGSRVLEPAVGRRYFASPSAAPGNLPG